jgi:hypothetical protein
MVSRKHFLREFDLHLLDLGFVPRVHNGVRVGLRGVDESMFLIIAPRPSSVPTNGSKPERLVGMEIFLEDKDSYRFRLPGHCGDFSAEMC